MSSTSAPSPPPAELRPLTPSEGQELLGLARLAIERFVESGEILEAPPPDHSVSRRLQARQGAFVSLHCGSRLRGCVGFTESIKPLVEAVMENAVSAAARDLRFPPIDPGELAEVSIEISALSELFEIAPDEVTVGLHGLVIEDGGRRGILLPQVACEEGWDREAYLRRVCRKAALADGAWRTARLLGFTVQVFSEATGALEPPAARPQEAAGESDSPPPPGRPAGQ